MTAWRRTLKSWPKETARTADPASLPEWLRAAPADAGEEPNLRQAMLGFWLTFFGPGVLTLLLAWGLKPWIGITAFGAMVVVGFSASLIIGGHALNGILRKIERRRMRRTLNALTERGEPTLDGEVVGVAYADGFWTYPHRGNRDADLGVVRLDFDRLSFVGGETRFELPAAAIVGAEIRRIDWGLGVRAHVYVHWRQGERSGTLSLGLPFDGAGRHVRATLALRERIEAWRREPFPRRTVLCDLPPSIRPTAVDPTTLVSAFPKIGWRAKVLSWTAMLGMMFVVFFVLEVLSSIMRIEALRGLSYGYGAIILAPMIGPVLAQKIEKRLPARWRHPEAEVSPSLAARTDEDETVRVRA